MLAGTPSSEGWEGDTDTTAAPVGTGVPITWPRARTEASGAAKGWAPGAAAGGDGDGTEGPRPAIQAPTLVRLLAESMLGAATRTTDGCGWREERKRLVKTRGQLGTISPRDLQLYISGTTIPPVYGQGNKPGERRWCVPLVQTWTSGRRPEWSVVQ